MKLTANDYVTVEEGEYPAKFIGYEEKTTEFGEAVQFSFMLLDEENNGTEVRGLASKKLTPKSKMRGWIEGMLGRALEPKEEIELDDLLDRKVMLYISVDDTERGMFNRIEKIRVPKRKPRPVVEDDDEEEAPRPKKRAPAPETEEVPF